MKIITIRIAGVIGLAAAMLFPLPGTASEIPQHSGQTHTLIVRFKGEQVRPASTASRRARAAMITPEGMPLETVREYDSNALIMRLPTAMSYEQAQAVARSLESDPDVLSAVPDKRMYPNFVPGDTRFFEQWYLQDDEGIRGPSAWDITRGSALVTIAVLDTGYLVHQDLDPARRLAGYDFISDPFTANDGSGRDSDPTDTGDAVNANECGPGDPLEFVPSSWHGLAVTGVIGAFTNNITPDPLLNIAGVDHHARLLPVRVLGRCGGSFSDIADAMRWSVGLSVAGVPDNPNPAKVLNLSFSGIGACSQEEQAAIDAVRAQGATVIASAGNESEDVAGHSPANCAGVVVVAATDRLGGRASYTNVGQAVDLSAPVGDGGDFVLTLSNKGEVAAEASPSGDQLVKIQGTSFASAQVSGVVALMLAVNPSLTPATIEGLLRNTSEPFQSGTGNDCQQTTCGTGVLDAATAVAGALDPVDFVGNSVNLSSGGGGGGGCALLPDTGYHRPDLVWLLLFVMLAWKRLRLRKSVC